MRTLWKALLIGWLLLEHESFERLLSRSQPTPHAISDYGEEYSIAP